MITEMFPAAARHRRPLLVGGVVVAVAEAVVTVRHPHSVVAPAVVLSVVLLLLLLTLVSLRPGRPTVFVVRHELPAFVAPMRGVRVCQQLCWLVVISRAVGMTVATRADEWRLLDFAMLAVGATAAVLVLVDSWIGFDVSLRPDGLHYRRPLGKVIAPWPAIAVAQVNHPENRAGIGTDNGYQDLRRVLARAAD